MEKPKSASSLGALRSFLCAAAASVGAFCASADAYIASTKNTPIRQYSIDTGYHVGPRTRIDADFEFLARTADVSPSNPYQQFVYSTSGGFISRVYINGSTGNGDLAWSHSTNGNWTSTSQPITPGVRYRTRVDPVNNFVQLSADGVVVYEPYRPFDGMVTNKGVVSSATLKIFNAPSTLDHGAMMKLYSLQIYEEGKLQRDYVPAEKAGSPGLYDRVTKTFVKDDQMPAKAFAYGGTLLEVEDDGFVESEGDVGVNSRYFFNSRSRIEVDYALRDTSTTQQRIYGRDTAGPMSSFYVQGNGNLAFGCGDTFVISDTQTGIKADTLRHTAIIDVKNRKAAFVTGVTTNWSASGILATHAPSKASDVPIGIFAGIDNSKLAMSYNRFAKVRIYGIKFYTNGALVHDYRPHVQNGIAGLKDYKDGAFITSETSGNLKCGGSIATTDVGPGYIDTNGKATFDTGYVPKLSTRVEIDYMHLKKNKDCRVFSAYASNKLYFKHYVNGLTQYAWCCMDNKGNWTSTGAAVETLRRRTFILDAKNDFAALVTASYVNYSNSVKAAVSAAGGTLTKQDSGETLKIGCDCGGSLASDIRIYGLKIYEGGVLKCDYVPYVRNGEAGLYDNKSGKFRGSSSSCAFTAGGEIKTEGSSDAYIESDSTQGINLGYCVNGKTTRVECDFSFVDIAKVGDDYQQRVFGQDVGGGLLYAMYLNRSGQFRFGFGNSFNISSSFGAADMARHKAILDCKKAVAEFVTGKTTNRYSYASVAHDKSSTWPMGVFATPTKQDASS